MTMPVTKDLYCYKGQTYEQNFYFKQNGAPIDLTGITVKSQIRPGENSETLTADFDVAVAGSEGKVTLRLSDAVTATLWNSVYYWDMRAVDGDDTVKYWVRGKFIVEGRVTE